MASHIQNTISKEFDAFSFNYTEDMKNVVPHYLKLMSCFGADLPQDFKPKQILDLGVGNGNSTAAVMPVSPDAHYTLLDASAEMLSMSKERFKDYNTTVVQSYFSDYTYVTSTFDYIIAGFSLHHCDTQEKQQLFSSIYKALQLGGIFSFSDLCINKTDIEHPILVQEWKDFILGHGGIEKWHWLEEHYNAFDRPNRFEDQKKWLLAAGFSKVDVYWRAGFWMNVRAFK